MKRQAALLDLIKRFLQSAAAENWRMLPAKDFVQSQCTILRCHSAPEVAVELIARHVGDGRIVLCAELPAGAVINARNC